MLNYANGTLRASIIEEIKAYNNQVQKKESLKELEIFKGRILPYVKEYLEQLLSAETVKEMPVISSINICKRIIKQEASLYKIPPKRTFTNVSEEQAKMLEYIYGEMEANVKMMKANEIYKLQDQVHLQIAMVDGHLAIRPLMRHHIDAVPSPLDPEVADAYILSGFDRSMYAPRLAEYEDGENQQIADPEDYKGINRLAWWSDQYNFITDLNGNILSGQDVNNPLGMMPFVDVASNKDYEYFVRPSLSLTDFTVQFNAAMSDLGQIVRMQGYSQAYWKGPEDMMPPHNIQIGPAFLLKLPINPNQPVDSEFGFASPNADIAGSIQYIEMLLSTFLTAQGVDPNVVSGKGQGKAYTSGIERLLAMIEKFEASKSDMDAFRAAEKKMFEIVKQYLNTYGGTDLLEYNIGQLPEEAELEIEFAKPEMLLSEKEKLEIIQMKTDLGLMSQVEAIAFDRNLPLDAAEEVLKEIQKQDIFAEKIESPEEEETEVESMNGQT